MTNKEYWDSQAGGSSTTQDSIGEKLEIRAISDYVSDGMEVLDVGCGMGNTLFALTKQAALKRAIGLDFSGEMIKAAEKRHPVLEFFTHDIQKPLCCVGFWDLIYTQRCLINLSDWEPQWEAIQNLIGLLKPGGRLVLCENSLQALETINDVRVSIGLSEIRVPWHNCYLDELKMRIEAVEGNYYYEEREITSTYYFLSRIVNAYAARKGLKEPQYNSDINELALHLPEDTIPGFSQTKLWVWEKK